MLIFSGAMGGAKAFVLESTGWVSVCVIHGIPGHGIFIPGEAGTIGVGYELHGSSSRGSDDSFSCVVLFPKIWGGALVYRTSVEHCNGG